MRKPPLLWLNITIFALTGLITLLGVPAYAISHGFDSWQISAMLAGIVFCEISITAGYHRLWSHRAYEAHWIVRLILMIGGTFATQNSILHWSSDHRQHHRFVDDNLKDPYSARRGFWFSHIGWMVRDYGTDQGPAYNNCKDLKNDRIVMWQHRHYLPLVLGVNFGFPITLGLLHGDLWGMILLLGIARLAISHHMTFLINSLAHIWGKQPYSDQNTSKDNGVLALLTMGEGYHNYHHKFQRDYRNGILWWQFDPTKWLIRALSGLGLTKNLYRTPIERIEAAHAQMLLNRTSQKLIKLPQADELILRLQNEYDTLLNKMNALSLAQKHWVEAKKASVMEAYDLKLMQKKVQLMKANFVEQKKYWLAFHAEFA